LSSDSFLDVSTDCELLFREAVKSLKICLVSRQKRTKRNRQCSCKKTSKSLLETSNSWRSAWQGFSFESNFLWWFCHEEEMIFISFFVEKALIPKLLF
jgi:hypothetical protein